MKWLLVFSLLFLVGCEGKREYSYHEHHTHIINNYQGNAHMSSKYTKSVEVKLENATLDTNREPNIDGQLEVPIVGGP